MEIPSKISGQTYTNTFFFFSFPCLVSPSLESEINKVVSLKLILIVGNASHFLPEKFWPQHLTQLSSGYWWNIIAKCFKNLSRNVRLEAVMVRAHLNRHFFMCLVKSRGLKIWMWRSHCLETGRQPAREWNYWFELSCHSSQMAYIWRFRVFHTSPMLLVLYNKQ